TSMTAHGLHTTNMTAHVFQETRPANSWLPARLSLSPTSRAMAPARSSFQRCGGPFKVTPRGRGQESPTHPRDAPGGPPEGGGDGDLAHRHARPCVWAKEVR